MTSSDLPSINPYQASAEAPPLRADHTPDEELRGKLAAFRQQIHAIGGAWIIFGILLVPTASGISFGGVTRRAFDGTIYEGNSALLIVGNVLGLLALAWVFTGIAACLKDLWAIYTGLIINYVVLGGLVLTLPWAVCNIVVVIILALVVHQVHRVLRWAKELRAAGIPLTAKP